LPRQHPFSSSPNALIKIHPTKLANSFIIVRCLVVQSRHSNWRQIMPLTANSLSSWAFTCYSNLLYIHYTFLWIHHSMSTINRGRQKKYENQPMQSAALCLLNMLNRFVAIRCEQLLFIMNCTFSISITLSSFIFFSIHCTFSVAAAFLCCILKFLFYHVCYMLNSKIH